MKLMPLIPYQKSKLKNGLRVVLAPLKNTRAVTVLVLVKTGSRNEEKRINGVSHFLEHMFFKGTKKRPKKEDIASTLDGVGAEFNAFTGDEETGYYVKVEKSYFDLALDFVSDILLNSIFPQKEISRERRVILEEINMYYDNPRRYAFELWQKLLYGGQPAGRPLSGTPQSIGRIRRDDLKNYFNRQYRAGNIVICVAGNISSSAAKSKIKNYFQKTRQGEGRPAPGTDDSQEKPGVLTHFRKTGQTNLLLGVRGYSLRDERRYAISVLSTILGGNMSSRLFLTVREKLGLAYAVRTMADYSTDSGSLLTYAGVDNQNTIKALGAIWREYKKISNKKVGSEELKKAKNYIKGRTMLDLESSDEIAQYLGASELLRGGIIPPEKELRAIGQVTAGDVQEVANDVFLKKRANIVVVGPYRGENKLKEIFNA